MILPLLLLLQVGPAAPKPAEAPMSRYQRCAERAADDPEAGEAEASAWRLSGGGFLAQRCLAQSYVARENYAAAASAFEESARWAEMARDRDTADIWAQAGNAWLAAGDAPRAKTALDAALARGTLLGPALGEAHLDRARAIVAAGDATGARSDLDAAVRNAPDDPLGWLLSATLARRAGDTKRAQTDIDEALKRSPDDASVWLEAGNVAASSGDAQGARQAWNRAAQIGGESQIATAARAALTQFDAGK